MGKNLGFNFCILLKMLGETYKNFRSIGDKVKNLCPSFTHEEKLKTNDKSRRCLPSFCVEIK